LWNNDANMWHVKTTGNRRFSTESRRESHTWLCPMPVTAIGNNPKVQHRNGNVIPLNVTPFLELARALKTDLLHPREITSPPLSTQSPSCISMSRPSTNKALRPTTILQPQIRRATQGHRCTQPPGPPMGSTKKAPRVTTPCPMPRFRISSDKKELAAFGLNH